MSKDIKLRCKYKYTPFTDGEYSISIYSCHNSLLPEQFQEIDRSPNSEVSFSGKGYDLPKTKKHDVILFGYLYIDSKKGLTMRVKDSEIAKPTSEDGLINYLVDFVDGITLTMAKKIVHQYGENTLTVLEKEPEKISEIPRMRKKSVEKVIASFDDMKRYAELAELLLPFNISAKKIRYIHNKYTDERKKTSLVDLIKENPFILENVKGIGYTTLDAMTRAFRADLTNKRRIKCGIKFILKKEEKNGHLCLPQGELRDRAINLLNEGLPVTTITKPMVVECINEMAKPNVYELLGDNGFAYLPDNYIYEQKTARVIAQLLNVRVEQKDFDRYIRIAEQSLAITLANSQRKAVMTALSNQFSIITGGAGTGKTTVLKVILKALYKMGLDSDEVLLVAPTGKAAQRMKESTGHEAHTIHSALGIKADEEIFIDNDEEDRELDCKLIVVDESSMCDMTIAYKLFSAINPSKTRVIFLGDTGQLPSVGAGNVLYELLRSGVIPTTELNVIYRQAKDNYIVSNAYNFRHGYQIIKYNDDFQYFEEKDEKKAAELISDLYYKYVMQSDIDNVQVLSPLTKYRECSALHLNKEIQAKINPKSDKKREVEIGGVVFREGDRVIQTRNSQKKKYNKQRETSCLDSYERGEKSEYCSVFNGDTGRLVSIFRDDRKQYFFVVDFGYGRVVVLDREEIYDVDLAYALTIHRSQGSEYKTVIIPLLNYFSDKTLYRNLLYTGVTRAKERCIIVGSEDVIRKCIRVDRIVLRNTQLGWRIKKAYNEEKGD